MERKTRALVWLALSTLVAVRLCGPAQEAPPGPLNGGVKRLDFLSAPELEVVAELNRARTDPRGLAAWLRELKSQFRDKYSFSRDGESILMHEGLPAVDEAIAFLEGIEPLPPLQISRGLSLSAAEHVCDQGLHGGIGHLGSDGSLPIQRMNRHGTVLQSAGECVDYGNRRGRDIIAMLIIDDGVPGRGHRLTLFNPRYTTVGVRWGSHLLYRWMCVLDLASGFTEGRPDS